MTQRLHNLLTPFAAAVAVVLIVGVGFRLMNAQTQPGPIEPQFPGERESGRPDAFAEREQPQQQQFRGLNIAADFSREWTDRGMTVYLLRGNCRIDDGDTRLTSDTMVLWRKTESNVMGRQDRFVVYLEGNARIERPGTSLRETFLFWELSSREGVRFDFGNTLTDQPANNDPAVRRAIQRRKHSTDSDTILTPTQLVLPQSHDDFRPQLLSLQSQNKSAGIRRVRIFPRSAVSFSVQSFESKETTPPEQVWLLTGGVNMIIDGVAQFGVVDLSADRIVVWTQTAQDGEFQTETLQSQETPLEVYLEGNIVMRQGTNVVRASRAIYDARENRGLILNADIRSFIPEVRDTVRLRAQRVRQLSQNNFHARNAWFTTSKFGEPGYRIQASDVFIEKRRWEPLFGQTRIDPQTGQPISNEYNWVTSLNNTFFLENVPLLYFPYVSAPLENPNIPLRRINVGQDRIFGTRVRTVWNMFPILGMEESRGAEWNLLADYLSERGPGLGTYAKYRTLDLFGLPGPSFTEGLGYGIHDEGHDNLGSDRRNLVPKTEDRYRVQLRHRHDMPMGFTVFGELGLLSDRNFLEEYYEREFDRDKDVETLLHAKQQLDNFAWTATGRVQLNDFSTTTGWLPRGDLYLLSEPFLNGLFTWSTHTSAAYARLRAGDAPSDPNDVYVPLPYVADLDGGVFMTRHEVNAPFNLGPVKLVPYVLGEAAYWDQGFQRQNIDRYVGSAGLRGSIMFWRVFPNVQSALFNLNGLAHKSLFEGEYAYTDSSRGLNQIPQYNEFDENAQERFRNRLIVNTFNGFLPPQLEPRFYAVRTGAGRYVTSPYHELIDNQQVARLAWRNRLQTKVGPPERMRIKDWMTLDLEGSYFPNPNRDNFGEDFGLLGAFYRWNFSDRTSLLAGAQYDLFDNAPQLWDVGFLTARNSRGSLYVGLRQVKGAGLNSQILTTAFSYRMSPKWISTLGTAYDLGEGRNRGQSLTLTRVGADFLVHLGANFDASKNNAGFTISIEPRLGAFRSRMTQLGSLIPGQR